MSEQIEKGEWPTNEIPKNWEWVAFPDFFQDRTNSRRKLQKKSYQSKGAYQVIDQGEQQIGGFSDNSDLVSTANLPCIVWGDHTKCVKFVDQKFIQGADGVKVLEPQSAIDPLFAFRALQTVRLPDKGYSRHFKFLSSTKFPVAPLAEQRRIVAKLDSLFARMKTARDELARVPLLVERYKQTLLHQAFSGDLTKEQRPSYPALDVSNYERDADVARATLRGSRRILSEVDKPATILGPIPEGWHYGRLIDLIDLKVGFAFKSSWFEKKGVPLVRGANVAPGSLDWGDAVYLSSDRVEEFADYAVRAGDILLAMDRPLISTGLKVAIAKEGETPALLVQRVARMRPTEWATAGYIWWLLRSEIFLRHAISRATGSDLPHISGNDIGLTPVPVPPVDEQKEIVRRIEAAMEWLNVVASEQGKAAQLLGHLDQSLLTHAFRGELVPQEPNDEPAGKLLQRIRAERVAASAGRGRRPRRVG